MVSLELLTKIAGIVDYYDLSEAREISTTIWIRDVKKAAKMPSTHCRNLISWICIFWSFNLSQGISKATDVAI